MPRTALCTCYMGTFETEGDMSAVPQLPRNACTKHVRHTRCITYASYALLACCEVLCIISAGALLGDAAVGRRPAMFMSISVSSTASCRIWCGRIAPPTAHACCAVSSTCSCCLQAMNCAHALRTAWTWPCEDSHQALKERLEADVGFAGALWGWRGLPPRCAEYAARLTFQVTRSALEKCKT